MAVDFNSAVKAYNTAADAVKTAGASGGAAQTGNAAPGNEFLGMVQDSLGSAVEAGRHSEHMSMQQIAGKADLREVVTAVANAEHTLRTVVAVRDKVLEAYQQILRMPI